MDETKNELLNEIITENELAEKAARRKKRRGLKKSQIIICAAAASAVVLAAYGLNLVTDQSQIPEEAVPLDAAIEYPAVHFASYKQAEGIPLTLTATSVERDLSIYILDEDLQPVTNVGFEVEATDPEGESVTFTDEEGSGKIYVEDLEPGEYTLALQETGRFLVPEPLQVEVKAKIEIKVIENIDEQIVNAKNVNAAAEDAAFSGSGTGQSEPPPAAPPATPTDTVPFYESKVNVSYKNITVPVLANGKQVYKPALDSSGFLVYKNPPKPPPPPPDPDPEPPVDPDPPPGDNTEATAVQAGFFTVTRTSVMKLVSSDQPPVWTPVTYTPVLDAQGFFTSAYRANGSDGSVITGWDKLSDMFVMTTTAQTKPDKEEIKTLQGWQTVSGKTYYYRPDGTPVTGSHVIQGVNYSFDSNGVLQQNVPSQQKLTGVDISTYQSNINWTQARNSGIHFAMIRAGYRGYSSGILVEDDKFRIHAQGAQAAGVKVGLYYFTQAVNEREAVEEASAAIAIARKYGISVGYPIAIDIEYSNSARNGRADGISGAQRTAVARAFCDTVRSAGYVPMIYASKSWFENPSFLNISQLQSYGIWLAHWTTQTSYKGKIDMWQYTSSGSVPGISGRVDMNISYLGY